MARCWLVLLAISSSLVHGCWVGPDRIVRMNAEEIKSISNKDLCFAYDRGNRSSLVIQEVSRRDVDCIQVLRRYNISIASISSSQSEASIGKGQSTTVQNSSPIVTVQSKASGENPTVTIIDEFHNDTVKAVQKYQEFHSINFFVATMSVSGDKLTLSHEGNTTAKEQWAKNRNFQGWDA